MDYTTTLEEDIEKFLDIYLGKENPNRDLAKKTLEGLVYKAAR